MRSRPYLTALVIIGTVLAWASRSDAITVDFCPGNAADTCAIRAVTDLGVGFLTYRGDEGVWRFDRPLSLGNLVDYETGAVLIQGDDRTITEDDNQLFYRRSTESLILGDRHFWDDIQLGGLTRIARHVIVTGAITSELPEIDPFVKIGTIHVRFEDAWNVGAQRMYGRGRGDSQNPARLQDGDVVDSEFFVGYWGPEWVNVGDRRTEVCGPVDQGVPGCITFRTSDASGNRETRLAITPEGVTVFDALRLPRRDDPPAGCAAGEPLLYVDTSGAWCVCTAPDVWEAIAGGGVGTCQ